VPVADLVNALRAMNASQVRQDIVRANPYAKMVTANL
jgi:hypothetical protein